MVVTASGWVMKASPLLRVWPSCSRSALRYARSIRPRSAFGVIGADDTKQRIERGCLWSTGAETRDALTHLDALLLGAQTRAGGSVRLAVNLVGLGLGDDQSAARLMGDVASRPRGLASWMDDRIAAP